MNQFFDPVTLRQQTNTTPPPDWIQSYYCKNQLFTVGLYSNLGPRCLSHISKIPFVNPTDEDKSTSDYEYSRSPPPF